MNAHRLITLTVFFAAFLFQGPSLSSQEKKTSDWSAPTTVYSQDDRKKVVALFPLGLHVDGDKIEIIYTTLRRRVSAGKKILNAEFVMARSSNGGREWNYVAGALDSPGLLSVSRPRFHEGFWHMIVQLEGTAPTYVAIHPDTGVSEATPIRLEGNPRVSRYMMPTLRFHLGRIYVLMTSGAKGTANRVYLLESTDGKAWKNIAPESWRHYSFRDGRPILYTSRALIHVLLREHKDAWHISHYRRFDGGADKWNRVRIFGHESMDTFPFAAAYSGNRAVVIHGGQWTRPSSDYTLNALTLDGSGSVVSMTRSVAPRVFKVFNEWTTISANNGRFMLLSDRNVPSSRAIGLNAVYSANGLDWKNIAFDPPEDTIQIHPIGAFSNTGRTFNLAYLEVKKKYETGPMRLVFRRWTPK